MAFCQDFPLFWENNGEEMAHSFPEKPNFPCFTIKRELLAYF
jgi:hypothetical protein